MGGLTTYCGGSVAPETHDQNTAGQCQKNTGMLEAVKEKLSMKKQEISTTVVAYTANKTKERKMDEWIMN